MVSLTIARSAVTAWRGLPSTVWLLVTARAVNRLGAFTLPFLSVTLMAEVDASVTQAGYLLAAFGLATIPSRLFGGRLSDRWGRRATIVGGLLATAFAQLLVAASQTLTQASVAVVLLGLAFEIYEPASQSLVADATSPEQRPAAFGLLAAALAAAGMAAGLLAALLAGVDLRWLLVVDAVSCLVCAVVVRLLLPGAGSRNQPGARQGARPWSDRRLLLLLGLGAVFAVVYLQVVVSLPLTVTADGLPASAVGILLTVSASTIVLGQPLLAARPLHHLDDVTALAVGHLVLAAGFVLTGFADGLTAYVVATIVWSLGDLVLLGRVYTLVSAIAPESERGAYLAAFGTSWGVAAVVAPVLGTQLLAATTPAVTWSVMAGVCAALAAAYLHTRGVLGDALPLRADRVVASDPW
jgi:MFS family permease